MKKPFSRRQYRKYAGLTLGAGAFTCGGLATLASRPPRVETPEFSYGEENHMNKSILVAYATRAGSTAEVAAAIGKHLSDRNLEVRILPIKENPSLDGYQAVILGSAIRMGEWLPMAVDYVKDESFEYAI